MVVNLGSMSWALLLFKYFRSMSGLSHSFCRWSESKTIVRSKRSLDFVRSRFTRAHPLEPELLSASIFWHNSYQIKCFLKQYICIEQWFSTFFVTFSVVFNLFCNLFSGFQPFFCHRALNVNSSPVNSSHSKIISMEWLSIREYEWAKYADVYLGPSHPLKPELPSTNKHFLNIIHIRFNVFEAIDLHRQVPVRE